MRQLWGIMVAFLLVSCTLHPTSTPATVSVHAQNNILLTNDVLLPDNTEYVEPTPTYLLTNNLSTEAIVLKNTAQYGKYGLVVLNYPNGSFKREFKITGEELQKVQATSNGIPPGVTKEEWEAGQAILIGKDFDTGDVQEVNGWLIIKYAEHQEEGHYVESFLELAPGEWSGKIPSISVTKAIIDETKNSTAQEKISVSKPLVAITDGVVTYEK